MILQIIIFSDVKVSLDFSCWFLLPSFDWCIVLDIRCASGPRQQSELLRSHRRRHGRGHRLLGQFPPDLELNKPLPCCTQSLPANYPPSPPPTQRIPTHLLGWSWRGVHCVSQNPLNSPPSSPLSAGNLPTCEKLPTLSTLPSDVFFFTQLLHSNNNKNLFTRVAQSKIKIRDELWKTEGKKNWRFRPYTSFLLGGDKEHLLPWLTTSKMTVSV